MRLLEHHERLHGRATLEAAEAEGHPVLASDVVVARLQATGPAVEIETLALALGAICDVLSAEQDRQRRTTERLVRMARRLKRAEQRLLDGIEERRTELLRQSHAIADVATTDPLTGVLNRRALDVRLGQMAEACAEAAAPMAVLFCDVDHFKRVNDNHGHAVGDRVLARIGKLMMEGRRRGDLVGRWGGEEFIVVLPDCPPQAADRIAEKIREKLSRQVFEGAEGAFSISMSLGVAVEVLGQGDLRGAVAELVETADARLYVAKGAGRNRVVSGLTEAHREAS
ncbi:MAG TPA: GGDEF domain-containing protein [Myxococcota bacterium]|nr:GGDEF domain-containing protein [Myxococcota bacterium]